MNYFNWTIKKIQPIKNEIRICRIVTSITIHPSIPIPMNSIIELYTVTFRSRANEANVLGVYTSLELAVSSAKSFARKEVMQPEVIQPYEGDEENQQPIQPQQPQRILITKNLIDVLTPAVIDKWQIDQNTDIITKLSSSFSILMYCGYVNHQGILTETYYV